MSSLELNVKVFGKDHLNVVLILLRVLHFVKTQLSTLEFKK